MSDRVNLGKAAPELYQAVAELERLASARAEAAGLAKGFTHLLRLRASQINGCAFCLRMHAHDALAAGEAAERLAVLPAWRETGYFDARERAALALVEALTRIADDQLPDTTYAEAAAALSAEEIAAVEWVAIVINVWNRIAIPSRYEVAPA